MAGVLWATLVYAAASIGLTIWLHGNFVRMTFEAAGRLDMSLELFARGALQVWPVILVGGMLLFRKRIRAQPAEVLQALGVTMLVPVAFGFAKNAIPYVVPYYADPMLAQFGLWLHMGHSPWRIAHGVIGPSVAAWFPLLYDDVWPMIAFAFPVIIAATDPDRDRIRRYGWLFFLTWVVLGNLLAAAFSSVGPVFYDRLIGSDRFAPLHEALVQSGLADGPIGSVQAYLWSRYISGTFDLGLAMSAFPSLHVAIATLAACYLSERSWLLMPVGVAFAATIFAISIYSGYHYSVDGYASILLVIAGHIALRRWLPPLNGRAAPKAGTGAAKASLPLDYVAYDI